MVAMSKKLDFFYFVSENPNFLELCKVSNSMEMFEFLVDKLVNYQDNQEENKDWSTQKIFKALFTSTPLTKSATNLIFLGAIGELFNFAKAIDLFSSLVREYEIA